MGFGLFEMESPPDTALFLDEFKAVVVDNGLQGWGECRCVHFHVHVFVHCGFSVAGIVVAGVTGVVGVIKVAGGRLAGLT